MNDTEFRYGVRLWLVGDTEPFYAQDVLFWGFCWRRECLDLLRLEDARDIFDCREMVDKANSEERISAYDLEHSRLELFEFPIVQPKVIGMIEHLAFCKNQASAIVDAARKPVEKSLQ